MDDIYIYLGYVDSTYFYIHLIQNPNLTLDEIIDMSGQIYNVMINETMIKFNDKVIIFDFSSDDKIHTIVINHINFEDKIYPIKDLKKIMRKLLKIKRPDETKMIIKYNGINYEVYEFNGELPTFNVNINSINIETINYVHCVKSINYL
ncbi:hypothetical protein QLL95_gp0535 [Cotonvirus japonicus]|uniref:Uncharacterized protein n=1 Tax=Cotonvirus japonicus TaxID=2811091 RepID=A0ABM7NTU0_9VIRU|nr:hypothetical protein QLL95_gp0535 [Cotonvirus japonicus]BCS83588.1 hypothetical protein [Cotonvirus japonicus]